MTRASNRTTVIEWTTSEVRVYRSIDWNDSMGDDVFNLWTFDLLMEVWPIGIIVVRASVRCVRIWYRSNDGKELIDGRCLRLDGCAARIETRALLRKRERERLREENNTKTWWERWDVFWFLSMNDRDGGDTKTYAQENSALNKHATIKKKHAQERKRSIATRETFVSSARWITVTHRNSKWASQPFTDGSRWSIQK